jgi:hypothetical protein
MAENGHRPGRKGDVDYSEEDILGLVEAAKQSHHFLCEAKGGTLQETIEKPPLLPKQKETEMPRATGPLKPAIKRKKKATPAKGGPTIQTEEWVACYELTSKDDLLRRIAWHWAWRGRPDVVANQPYPLTIRQVADKGMLAQIEILRNRLVSVNHVEFVGYFPFKQFQQKNDLMETYGPCLGLPVKNGEMENDKQKDGV